MQQGTGIGGKSRLLQRRHEEADSAPPYPTVYIGAAVVHARAQCDVHNIRLALFGACVATCSDGARARGTRKFGTSTNKTEKISNGTMIAITDTRGNTILPGARPPPLAPPLAAGARLQRWRLGLLLAALTARRRRGQVGENGSTGTRRKRVEEALPPPPGGQHHDRHHQRWPGVLRKQQHRGIATTPLDRSPYTCRAAAAAAEFPWQIVALMTTERGAEKRHPSPNFNAVVGGK